MLPPDLDKYEQQLAGYREAGDAPLPPSPLVTEAFRPIPPHKVGVCHLLLKPRFGLFDPTGTGKTPQTLVSYAYLRQAQPDFKAIIVARQKSMLQWQAEASLFLKDLPAEIVGFNPKRPAHPLDAAGRAAQYARLVAGETPILIASRLHLVKDWTKADTTDRRKRRRVWCFDPKGLGSYALIIDEIHNIRGHEGKLLHPGLRLLSESARYTWGLTATPLFGEMDDLYAVFELIRPGLFGSYARFQRDFCTGFKINIPIRKGSSKTRPVFRVTGGKNLGILMAKLAPYYLQRPDEVFDRYLPSVRVKTVSLPLEKAQRELYERIVAQRFPRQHHTDYRSAKSMAHAAGLVDPNDHEQMGKIASLLYAQLAVDCPEVLGVICPSAKQIELLRFLQEDAVQQQTIVYTRFAQVADVLLRDLRDAKIPAVRITGEDSPADARAAQLAFQAQQARVVIITSAGGESIDLQVARNVVFYDLPWTPGEFRQVLGRARRQGNQNRSVLVLLLGTTHTIDSKALNLLQRKEKLVAATFDLKDLQLDGATFEAPNIHSPVPDTVLRSASVSADADVLALFDLMQQGAAV